MTSQRNSKVEKEKLKDVDGEDFYLEDMSEDIDEDEIIPKSKKKSKFKKKSKSKKTLNNDSTSTSVTEGDLDATKLYLGEIGFSPLLTAKEEVYYSRKARKGDEMV